MDPRKCEKCGETVDAAKSFCPGCGTPMEAEQERTRVSEYDATAGTVQFGKTVYNQLLSDMGLNIAETKATPARTVVEAVPQPIKLAPEKKPEAAFAKNSKMKWVIAAVVALFLAATAVIGLIALFVYLRWEQL